MSDVEFAATLDSHPWRVLLERVKKKEEVHASSAQRQGETVLRGECRSENCFKTCSFHRGHEHEQPSEDMECANCKSTVSEVRLKRCGRCRVVWYCDEDCQTEHWIHHREKCLAPREEVVLNARVNGKIQPFPNLYGAGCYASFERQPDGTLKPQYIEVNGYKVLPSDRDEWRMAKLFVMQCCRYQILFAVHPDVHFPSEAFLVITPKMLSQNHPLMQLMAPHMKWVSEVNNAVIFGEHSAMDAERTCWCWQAHYASRDELHGLMRYGYPHPNFTTQAPRPEMQPLFIAIHEYVVAVVDHIIRHDDQESFRKEIEKWGDALHHYLGYPFCGAVMAAERDLRQVIDIVTDFIFRSSVRHSCDHNGFFNLGPLRHPFRLRQAFEPGVKINRQLVTCPDFFKAQLFDDTFVTWHNQRLLCSDSRLINTVYGYHEENLQTLAAEFRRRLRELRPEFDKFMNMDRIAKSIEW